MTIRDYSVLGAKQNLVNQLKFFSSLLLRRINWAGQIQTPWILDVTHAFILCCHFYFI